MMDLEQYRQQQNFFGRAGEPMAQSNDSSWMGGQVNKNMAGRMNKLKTYMDIYDQIGAGRGAPSRMTAGGQVLSRWNLGDSGKAGEGGGMGAMDWAETQLANEGRGAEPVAGQFYNQQPQQPQQQYVQPQSSQQENPYSARAQQLNQGNGMGGDITNYLRKIMEGQRGFGNSTPGVRG